MRPFLCLQGLGCKARRNSGNIELSAVSAELVPLLELYLIF